MESNPFKVIIAGGSVAGLSLALMLEKSEIDFVVLEGYPIIAPQVGASIGMLPNGLRILDQLGCCNDVIKKADIHVSKLSFQDSRGESFWSFDNFGEQMKQNHSYPLLFLERRALIQTLYDHLQDKSKVFTSEKIVTIKNSPRNVTVTTSTGKTFTGDILVGADGINSTVRQKMWEESQSVDSTWIDLSEINSVPATYSCLFGISDAMPGIEKQSLNLLFNDKFSYLTGSGTNKTYWMLFKHMGKTYNGEDIPRLTKKDEEALVREHWDDHVSPTVRFSELYKHKVKSVYTCLVEHVFKRWYFQRTITIGDACHKLHPLTGQGGNSAIETSAALANHLVTALNENHSMPLSTEHLASVFEKTQRQRHDRVTNLIDSAHIAQRFGSLDTPAIKFAVRYFVPYMPTSLVANSWIVSYCPAVSLSMLPLPNLPRKVPFHDDPPQARRHSRSTELAIYMGSISIGSVIFILFALRYLFDFTSFIHATTGIIPIDVTYKGVV